MFFRFPDVADFPENDAPTFPEDIPYPDFQGDFQRDLKRLGNLLAGINNFTPAQERILAAQIERVSAAELRYKALPDTRGGGSLSDAGILAFSPDTSELAKYFAPDIDELLNYDPPADKPVKDIDRAKIRRDEGARAIVSGFLKNTGAGKHIAEYQGEAVGVVQVVVHVSKPGDRHHYQQFSDCKTTTKLLNLHMDPKPGIVKALIYLGDVGPEDGPFQFIRGSSHWEYDEVDRIFAWGNSVGNYCNSPDHRIVANSFPRQFRGNAIVGRLIPDGTWLSGFLLKNLTDYTSDVATVMVFDPCFNLHRGGQCKSGTRINLQVVLN